jgi:hypothetical protein
MSAKKFKTGGVSQCFHCQRQLTRIKDGFIFSLIKDPAGHEIRVHKQCAPHAIGHGYRAVDAAKPND